MPKFTENFSMTFAENRTYGVPEFAGTEVNQHSGKLKGLSGGQGKKGLHHNMEIYIPANSRAFQCQILASTSKLTWQAKSNDILNTNPMSNAHSFRFHTKSNANGQKK